MKIMGILNITPDSFSDGGEFLDVDKAVRRAVEMKKSGADIIDIGGESTRPGATPVTLEEELARVVPVIKKIREVSNIPISIDTYKAEVAVAAVAAGAGMINDVWAGRKDPRMLKTMAQLGVPVILMHNRKKDEENNQIHDIVAEVSSELQETIQNALDAGIKKENIILDPGIGFGKTLDQNIELIKNIGKLKEIGYPIMLAASKKRTIRNLSKSDDMDMIAIGTIATTCHAYINGIDFVRVHDVKENKTAVDVMHGLN